MPRRFIASTARRVARTLFLVALLGCGSDRTVTPPPVTVASIEISAANTTLPSGATVQLTATVRGSNGATLGDRALTWSTADALLATVDGTGRVTAGMVRGGTSATVTITATAEGRSGAVQLTVTPVPVARVELAPLDPVLRIGVSQPFTVQLRDSSNQLVSGRAVTWSSTAPLVATISPTGVATAIAPGTTQIRAQAEGVTTSTTLTVPPVPGVTLQVTGLAPYPLRGDTAILGWQSTAATACSAFGSWSGARATQGTARVTLDGNGQLTFGLTCTGLGGETSRDVRVLARRPVLATSYDNFKALGIRPTWMPKFNDAHAYADFLGDGSLALFTAYLIYDPARPIEEARPGVFEFWKLAADSVSWVRASVTVVRDAENCLHPRKAIVTDVNRDRRPDIYLMCHGYDANPYPGERSLVLLSQPDGSYRQQHFSPRVAFYHGAATCDLEGDGITEMVTADGNGVRLWRLDPSGTATIDPLHPLSQLTGTYYTVECVDVDEDGRLDVIIGGHEPKFGYGNIPTEVWLGRVGGTFARRTVPALPNDGTVLDYLVTGTGAGRTLWVLRTSDGTGTAYIGSALQRVPVGTFSSTVPMRGADWFPWIISYARGTTTYIGTDALGRGWEYSIVP